MKTALMYLAVSTLCMVCFGMGLAMREIKYDMAIHDIENVAYQYYEQQLENPERCLSVCVAEFERMGC